MKDAFAFVEFRDPQEAAVRVADPGLDLYFYGRVMVIRLAQAEKPEAATGPAAQHATDETRVAALLRAEVRRGAAELGELEALLAARRHASLAAHVRRGYGSLADFVASRPDMRLVDGRVLLEEPAAADSLPASRSSSTPSATTPPSPGPAAVVALAECPNCRTLNLPNFIYCCSCGVKRGPPRCSACQSENLVSFRFCSSCGKPNLV